MTDTNNLPQPSLWRRLINRLFPTRAVPAPPTFEGWWNDDYMQQVGEIAIGIKDRVRLIVSGRLVVQINVRTDVPVKQTCVQAGVYVLPPKSLS